MTKRIKSDITILGGGLTALTIAYFLRNSGLKITIIEARDRLGGRIYTDYQPHSAPIEIGATWLGAQHTQLMALLKELKIDIFEQELGENAIYEPISTSPHQIVSLPANSDPSYRIKGGSSVVIDTLRKLTPQIQVFTGQIIDSIKEITAGLSVNTNTYSFESDIVISTLPPNLLVSSIKINPHLPMELSDVAHSTHTWMGESIKIGLRYSHPFWRDNNLSGTIVSNVGPIPEMYDHSDFNNSAFALKGFLNSSYFSLTRAARLEIILEQLSKYYGEQVRDFKDYQETIWRNDPYTFCDYQSHILPHQNNGHPVYQKPYLNGRLYIGGSETANHFPGYMEGAVRSAQFIFGELEYLLAKVY